MMKTAILNVKRGILRDKVRRRDEAVRELFPHQSCSHQVTAAAGTVAPLPPHQPQHQAALIVPKAIVSAAPPGSALTFEFVTPGLDGRRGGRKQKRPREDGTAETDRDDGDYLAEGDERKRKYRKHKSIDGQEAQFIASVDLATAGDDALFKKLGESLRGTKRGPGRPRGSGRGTTGRPRGRPRGSGRGRGPGRGVVPEMGDSTPHPQHHRQPRTPETPPLFDPTPVTELPPPPTSTPTPQPAEGPAVGATPALAIPIVRSELAERDAVALRRMEELRRQGLWGGLSGRGGATPRLLLPKELPRQFERDHWAFLLTEMEWLAKDFRREREAKEAQAKRLAKAAAKHVKVAEQRAERAVKDEEASLHRIAATMVRAMKTFWNQIGKIVAYKQQQKIEAERSEKLTQHLHEVVQKAGQLTESIARDLADQAPAAAAAGPATAGKRPATSPAPTQASVRSEESEEEDEAEEEGDEEDERSTDAVSSKEAIDVVAQQAQAAQPTGTTLATTNVKTKVPPLLVGGTLREYQHVGLDWLATMYENNLNVILADEMGLGKTIMTIALLAHLACEKQVWGPHLIIVPSSTVMNWELELKIWCPGLKVVTYIGSPKERKLRRAGWSKDNAMHVCITSYRLALQDSSLFRRKRWVYMILDEAQNIKNFKSQRWQTLLQFHSERRLLLTGTPLQNSIMELWSLMHFLMPKVFDSHSDFAKWFSVPLTALVEKGDVTADPELVKRLHAVLRPFLLRRVKRDVEKNLPPKREVIVHCRLSRRQQYLYEEFINATPTQETLASGSYMGVVNILMQLRKVCNHPDLFTPRPTESPFDLGLPIVLQVPPLVLVSPTSSQLPSLALAELRSPGTFAARSFEVLASRASEAIASHVIRQRLLAAQHEKDPRPAGLRDFLDDFARERARQARQEHLDALMHAANLNKRRAICCLPVFGGESLRALVTIRRGPAATAARCAVHGPTLVEQVAQWAELAPHFVFLHARAVALPHRLEVTRGHETEDRAAALREEAFRQALLPAAWLFEPIAIRLMMHFPDKRLLQYDSGKLQELAVLLRDLRDGGHKVVLFTQMAKVLDIIESFANMHRYTYVRLDGSTRVDRRQILVERFNRDSRIFLFLSTTRSGGFGINLTGADTVVFYDSDWNPAVDAQAQDRCHRIGQTRDVTIYRLVTESTVEENIIKKARQKKALNRVVIKEGAFNTEFLAGLGLEKLIHRPEGEATPEPPLSKKEWVSGEPEQEQRQGIDTIMAAGADDEQAAAAAVAAPLPEKELEAALVVEDEDARAEMEQEKEIAKEFAEDQPAVSESPQPRAPSRSASSRPFRPSVGDIAAEDEMMAAAVAAAEPHTIESEMSALQLYALRFLENVDPFSGSTETPQPASESPAPTPAVAVSPELRTDSKPKAEEEEEEEEEEEAEPEQEKEQSEEEPEPEEEQHAEPTDKEETKEESDHEEEKGEEEEEEEEEEEKPKALKKSRRKRKSRSRRRKSKKGVKRKKPDEEEEQEEEGEEEEESSS